MDGARIESAPNNDRWSAFAAHCLPAIADALSIDATAHALVDGAVGAFGRVCALDVVHPIVGLRRAAFGPVASLLPAGRWPPQDGLDAPMDDASVLGHGASKLVFADARFEHVLALRLHDGDAYLGHLWIAITPDRPLDEAEVALARRVARLASTALARARDVEALVRAVRRRDETAALAEHELRSPLATMLGWAHLLKTDAQGERVRRGVDAIERGGLAMTRVIEDWHQASELLLGNLVLEPSEVELDALVRAVVELRRRTSEHTTIAIRVATLDDTRAVVDPARVRELLERMLDRIERITPEGATIVVRLASRGDAFLLSVEGQASCSERESSSVRARGATHVGDRTLTLAVVRGLAELHGGSAGAERADTRLGARIWALLPRGTRTAIASPSSHELDGVSVLLVDDAADSLELAATIVRLRGARTAVASSSSEAMALLRELPIDVLVSDIAMPSEDGCSLVRRAHELRPGLRAAALSAYAQLEDRERALAAGFETYLTKPIDPETLARTVRSLAHPTPPRGP